MILSLPYVLNQLWSLTLKYVMLHIKWSRENASIYFFCSSQSFSVWDSLQNIWILSYLYDHYKSSCESLPVQVGSEEESSSDSRHVTLELPSRMYPVSHWNEKESLYTTLEPDWHGPSNVDRCAEYSGTVQLITIWERKNVVRKSKECTTKSK